MKSTKKLKQLIALKRKQIEALEQNNLERMHQIDKMCQSLSEQLHIKPSEITQDVIDDLHELKNLTHTCEKVQITKRKRIPHRTHHS